MKPIEDAISGYPSPRTCIEPQSGYYEHLLILDTEKLEKEVLNEKLNPLPCLRVFPPNVAYGRIQGPWGPGTLPLDPTISKTVGKVICGIFTDIVCKIDRMAVTNQISTKSARASEEP